MRTRDFLIGVTVLGAGLVACSDSFGVDDALGIWDVRAFNGQAVPGDVSIALNGGQDSVEIGIERFWFEFFPADDCAYTIQQEGEAPFETTDCIYTVREGGDVTVRLNDDFTLDGSGDGGGMTLRDEDGNVLELRRR